MHSLSLNQLKGLAINVWREAMRDKLVQIIAGSGIFAMLVSLVLGQMAVGGPERVLQNFGFWIFGIWGLIAVMYMGSNIVRKEFNQKTAYLILSRPVNRYIFLTGKLIGMIFVLMTAFSILAIVWLLLIQLNGIPVTSKHIISLSFIFGEWILLAAFSLFFASFTSPLLHNFFIFGLSFLGHWSNDLNIYSENVTEFWLKYLLKGIYYVLPNLDALNFRKLALYNQELDSSLLINGGIVLIAWIVLAFIAAQIIFSYRKMI